MYAIRSYYGVSIEDIEAMKVKFGLDKPIPGQYVDYMKNLMKGDLGISFWQKKPVEEVIAARSYNFV